VGEDLITATVELPGGNLRLLQPREWADLPDDGAVEWAPLAPYWSVLWRSGTALAGEVASADVSGRRVVELGCGMATPSLAAARGGAAALATDAEPEPLELLARNAELNGVRVETAAVNWNAPDDLVARGPFDLVLAGDVLYERSSVALLLELLPRLAPEAWVADPGRPAAEAFLNRARELWEVEECARGLVTVYRLAPR
jgi:predicted nicotinamide N-methyase